MIDITGTVLIPGNLGEDCPGNGARIDIECCCEECDYQQCCVSEDWETRCSQCGEAECPRNR